MSNIIILNRVLVLAALLIAWGIGGPITQAKADDCITTPNAPTPKGSHWYYHTDRVKHRKCWFLRRIDQPAEQPGAQDASAKATPADATKKPASAPAAKLASTHAAAAPLPLHESATAGAAPDEQATQSMQELKTAPAAPQASESAPAASSAALAAAPASTSIWPDPPPAPTVAPAATPFVAPAKPNLVPSDFQTPTAPPAAAPPIRAAKPAAHGNTATTEIKRASVTSAPAPMQMLLVALLALVAAAVLYHLARKVVAMRRGRIRVERTQPEWTDDRGPPPWRTLAQADAREQQRAAFVNDDELSIVPPAGEPGIRRPLRSVAERQARTSRSVLRAAAERHDTTRDDIARSRVERQESILRAPARPAAPPETPRGHIVRPARPVHAAPEHDSTWEQLVRELDELLQTKKQA